MHPYSDPKLRDPQTYGKFLGRLYQSNLVEFVDEPGVEEIAVFFVQEEWHVENDNRCPQKQLPLQGSGLCAALYRRGFGKAGARPWCRAYGVHGGFERCVLLLPSVASGRYTSRHSTAGGSPIRAGIKYYPRIAVVPMGWSWALWVCQHIHENLIHEAGLAEHLRVRDRRPSQHPDLMHTEYVDNLLVFGQDRERVLSA